MFWQSYFSKLHPLLTQILPVKLVSLILICVFIKFWWSGEWHSRITSFKTSHCKSRPLTHANKAFGATVSHKSNKSHLILTRRPLHRELNAYRALFMCKTSFSYVRFLKSQPNSSCLRPYNKFLRYIKLIKSYFLPAICSKYSVCVST